MRYYELKDKHQKRINDLPMIFAFSSTQFDQKLAEKGWTKEEIVGVNYGGYMRKADVHLLKDAMKANEQEREDFLATDEGLFDALKCELSNTEYCVNEDPTDALAAVGVSITDERVARLLLRAIESYMADVVW